MLKKQGQMNMGSIDEHSSKLLGFMKNFSNIMSVEFLTPQEKNSSNEYFLNHLKKRCTGLLSNQDPSEGTNTRIKILLLERGFDLLSPCFLDMHYEPLLSDILGVDLKTPEQNNNVSVKYDESSPLYLKYRYAFLDEVLKNMEIELKEFKKKYKMFIGDDMNKLETGQINDAVRNIAQHNREKHEITIHLSHSKGLDQWMSQYQILEIAEKLSRIGTGTSDGGSNVANDQRLRDIQLILESCGSEQIRLRSLLMGLSTITKNRHLLGIIINIKILLPKNISLKKQFKFL